MTQFFSPLIAFTNKNVVCEKAPFWIIHCLILTHLYQGIPLAAIPTATLAVHICLQ